MTLSIENAPKDGRCPQGPEKQQGHQAQDRAASTTRWQSAESKSKLVGQTKYQGASRALGCTYRPKTEEHRRKTADAMKRAWAKRKAQQPPETH
jgi:hypothetical protein